MKWRDVFARRVFCGKSVITFSAQIWWHSPKDHNTSENQQILYCALWKWCSYCKRPCTLQCVAFPSPQWWNSCLVMSSDSSSVFCASIEETPDSPSDRGIRHAQCLSWGLHLTAPCRWHEGPPSGEHQLPPLLSLRLTNTSTLPEKPGEDLLRLVISKANGCVLLLHSCCVNFLLSRRVKWFVFSSLALL